MTEFWGLMLKPFAACLILAGMHVYLGLHVIKRGVIFVDLALAQVAALGATVGFFFGYGLHTPQSYGSSLLLTLVAAVAFAALRGGRGPVPIEAYIGIVYVVAAAAGILVLSRAPDGGEELKALMVGHLLFVDWPEIIKVALIYGGIAWLHWRFRRPLLRISQDVAGARAEGMRVFWWDFFFYGSFGFVVSSSVELAGVLVVFAFLVVPAVCGALLARETVSRLLVGWLVGFATSALGIWASYYFDLPTGATVVCAFGVALLLCLALMALLAKGAIADRPSLWLQG